MKFLSITEKVNYEFCLRMMEQLHYLMCILTQIVLMKGTYLTLVMYMSVKLIQGQYCLSFDLLCFLRCPASGPLTPLTFLSTLLVLTLLQFCEVSDLLCHN